MILMTLSRATTNSVVVKSNCEAKKKCVSRELCPLHTGTNQVMMPVGTAELPSNLLHGEMEN